MDIFKRFLTRIGSSLSGFFGVELDTRSNMTPRRAIEYAPVWKAVSTIGGHFAQLPINCHRRLERGAEVDRRHPGHKLVHTRPNEYQTPPEWKMMGAVSLLLYGNWRSVIVREGSRPVRLLPLNPYCSSSIWYEGERWHGTTICKDEPLARYLGLKEVSQSAWFKDEDVLFVHGLSLDGVSGINPMSVMGNSLDAGLSTEEHVRNQAKKGFSGSLILETPSGIFRNEEEAKKFLAMFREAHDGAENAGKTAMLREGIKANMVTMSGKDSQWIEQRLFQRQEAALWFCLEEILGDDSSVSYNSLAEKHLAYLTNCLNRWLVHIEAACDRSLLTEKQLDSESHYFKFNTNALMRMDPTKNAEYLTKLIAATVISPNEAREKLDLNPYEGGDNYQNPAITVTENPSEIDENDDENGENGAENDQTDAKRRAVVGWIKHMIAVEQKQVASAAKAKNFVAAIDRFYGKWQVSFGKVCEELGGDAAIAADHCRASQDALIEAMASSGKESLSDTIGELVASWSERAEELADRLLGAVDV